MEHHLDNYFLALPEPEQSTLLFLRHFFIKEMKLQEHWKYNTPFYYYDNKWFCYLSYSKKKQDLYVGFVKGYKVTHTKLLDEGRKQIKIYRIHPEEDINTKELSEICKLLKGVYQ